MVYFYYFWRVFSWGFTKSSVPLIISVIPALLYLLLLISGYSKYSPFSPPLPTKFSEDIYYFIIFSMAYLSVSSILSIAYVSVGWDWVFLIVYACLMGLFFLMWFSYLSFIANSYFKSKACGKDCCDCCRCCDDCDATSHGSNPMNGRTSCRNCHLIGFAVWIVVCIICGFIEPWILFYLAPITLVWVFINMMFSDIRWNTIPAAGCCVCYFGYCWAFYFVYPVISVFSILYCIYTQISSIFGCNRLLLKKGVTGTDLGIGMAFLIRRSINYLNIFICLFLVHTDKRVYETMIICAICQLLAISVTAGIVFKYIWKPLNQFLRDTNQNDDMCWDNWRYLGLSTPLYSIKKWIGNRDAFYAFQAGTALNHHLLDSVLTIFDICIMISAYRINKHRGYWYRRRNYWAVVLETTPLFSIILHFFQLIFTAYELTNRGFVDFYPKSHVEQQLRNENNNKINNNNNNNGIDLVVGSGGNNQSINNSGVVLEGNNTGGVQNNQAYNVQNNPVSMQNNQTSLMISDYSELKSFVRFGLWFMACLDCILRSFPYFTIFTLYVEKEGELAIGVLVVLLLSFCWSYYCSRKVVQELKLRYSNNPRFQDESFYVIFLFAIGWQHSNFIIHLMSLNRSFMNEYQISLNTENIFLKEVIGRCVFHLICVLICIAEGGTVFGEFIAMLIVFSFVYFISYWVVKTQIDKARNSINTLSVNQYIAPTIGQIQVVQPNQMQMQPVQYQNQQQMVPVMPVINPNPIEYQQQVQVNQPISQPVVQQQTQNQPYPQLGGTANPQPQIQQNEVVSQPQTQKNELMENNGQKPTKELDLIDIEDNNDDIDVVLNTDDVIATGGTDEIP